MKDWHLILIVLGVTGIGVVLVIIKSSTQVDPPELVRDKEDREGETVNEVAHINFD